MRSDFDLDSFSMFDQASISVVAERANYWTAVTSQEAGTPIEFTVDWASFPRGFAKTREGETEDAARRIDRDFEHGSYAIRKLAQEYPSALAALRIFKTVQVSNHTADNEADIFKCSFAGGMLDISNDFSQYATFEADRFAAVRRLVEDMV